MVFEDLKKAAYLVRLASYDLVDLLLDAAPEGGDLSQSLTQAREHLDYFSFGEAEALLDEIAGAHYS
ncbi:hypothetical protein CWI75_17760 [Kineobactrum sediminis]|uniref:Uncharacterized protein n=1 Tax=Kineobactrum sediminis TaxID=1905677 RepID=A0A2N5XY33_9GAMM|nr:hypothetical protein [Kineobactrum sediminis]PLW81022.1 hypothetical protein CWI75_17760 [Kineobactrum sediminis]